MAGKISEKANIHEGNERSEDKSIIIDAGYWLKAGFIGDDEPLSIVPSIIACYPPEIELFGSNDCGPFIGKHALSESSKSPSLNFSFPIECGLPVLMKDAELVFHHIFRNELEVDPEGRDIILTKKSLTPKKFLRQLAQSMFETFNARRISFMNSDLCALFANGRTSGVVVDMGTSQCMITPIVEGAPQLHAVRRLNLGGRDITEYYQRLLEESNVGIFKFRSAAEIDVVRVLKEKSCLVAPNWDDPAALRNTYSKSEKCFELPDGQEIRIGFERAQAPEILFNPPLSGSALEDGLANKIVASILECDINVRRNLYKSIILMGGTSMIPGLSERLSHELQNLAPKTTNINILSPENRDNYAWNNASGIADHPSLKTWTTREEYNNMDLSDINF